MFGMLRQKDVSMNLERGGCSDLFFLKNDSHGKLIILSSY